MAEPALDPANPPQDPPPEQLPLSPEPLVATSVSTSEHAKVLERLRLAEEQNKVNTEAAKAAELKTLQDQNNWKEVAERHEADAKISQEKLDNVGKAMVRDKKYSAIRAEAQKLGIRTESIDDLEMLEFLAVQVETTDLGNVNIIGAKEAAEDLKLKRPHWFGKSTANLNTGSPEVTLGGAVTLDSVMKARAKYKTSKDQADFATFEKLNTQYMKQQNG